MRNSVKVVAPADKWAAKTSQLEDLSVAQARADIALVEAQRAFERARATLESAVAVKTTAEKRLASFRQNLGAE